jgi:peptide/nickel transport system permease protein
LTISGTGWRALRDPATVVAAAVLAVIGVGALAAPWVAPHDPTAVDLEHLLEGPSRRHLLGTDGLGSDELSRLIHGARWSLGTALVVTVLVTLIGTAVGAAAGFSRGWVDWVVVRVVDALLAFPALLLALAIVGVVGPGLRGVLVALVSVGWATTARVVRGQALSLREQDYVTAARAAGAGDVRIIVGHVIPHVMSPVLVLASVEIGQLILALAGLSFLGLGVQSPTPEWGTMVNEGRAFLFSKADLMIWPGAAISVTVISCNLLGDRLREVFDPRLAPEAREALSRARTTR